ncbi:MAG: hypothetical protein ACLPY1_00940 [Terracidiphilus sp.]
MIRLSMIRKAFLVKALLVVVLFTLGSITALATDFNGKWTADVTTPRGTQTLTFDFHVDGATLTGKITSPRGDSDITEGKIDGDNISFTQVVNFNGNEMKIVYIGKADADGIKFTRTVGERPAVEFTATRPK